MIRKVLNIEGMSCEHCVMAVTRAVSALAGVDSVEVSLENNTATVEYQESKLPLETIEEAIEGQGYDVV
jgi:copper chaperone